MKRPGWAHPFTSDCHDSPTPTLTSPERSPPTLFSVCHLPILRVMPAVRGIGLLPCSQLVQTDRRPHNLRPRSDLHSLESPVRALQRERKSKRRVNQHCALRHWPYPPQSAKRKQLCLAIGCAVCVCVCVLEPAAGVTAPLGVSCPLSIPHGYAIHSPNLALPAASTFDEAVS